MQPGAYIVSRLPSWGRIWINDGDYPQYRVGAVLAGTDSSLGPRLAVESGFAPDSDHGSCDGRPAAAPRNLPQRRSDGHAGTGGNGHYFLPAPGAPLRRSASLVCFGMLGYARSHVHRTPSERILAGRPRRLSMGSPTELAASSSRQPPATSGVSSCLSTQATS